MAKEVAQAPGDSLFGALRNSPATKALTEQAKNLVEAQAGRVVDKVGDTIAGTADKLTKVGESGELPAIGEGAKRLLHGDSPVKAAAGAAKSSLGQKAGGLLDKIKGKGKGSGQAKAFNIEETIDVGVPVTTAYNQWSQFKDFSRFMKGVESVEQASETETNWRVKVFKSRRTWKGKIQEQIPDERIVWTSEGAKGSTKGVVTFHPLGDNLTRILLVIEYYPSGFFEKTGSLWRAAGRRARLDLKNYRRFVMMEGEATGEWRGEIRDGEVVDTGEDATESQEDEDATESQEEKPRRRRRASGSAESSAERRRPSSSGAGRQQKPSARAAKAEGSSEGTRRRGGATRQTRDGARSTRASASSGNGTRRASGTRSASASNGGGGRRATKATKTTASTRSRGGSRSS
jgi:uncharacterized membrane protein